MIYRYYTILLFAIFFTHCKNDTPVSQHKESMYNSTGSSDYSSVPTYHKEQIVNAIIEIPAGSSEKWEMDKTSGKIIRDTINGMPRTIDYLGYPAHYGMIPKTLLNEENGGDGDPLDVIVIGSDAIRGSVLPCKIIGILHLNDNGLKDDKLIAVSQKSRFFSLESMTDLRTNYPGITEIFELWFSNYKGAGQMISLGYGDKNDALSILNRSIEEYKSSVK